MDSQMVMVVVVVAGLLVVLMVALLPRSEAAAMARLERLGATVGLAVVGEVVPMLRRRLDRARRYRAAGAVILFASVFGGSLAVSHGFVGPADLWCAYAAVAAGSALGSGLAAVVDGRASIVPTGPLIARARAVTLEDYSPPRHRRLMLISAAVAVVALMVVAGFAGASFGLIGLIVLVVSGVLIAEFGSRSIVARPQLAPTSTVLAWDDATRAQNLHLLVEGGVMVPFYASIGAMLVAAGAVGRSGLPGFLVAVTAVVVTAIVMVVFAADSASVYYRRRLWPGLGASSAADAGDRASGA